MDRARRGDLRIVRRRIGQVDEIYDREQTNGHSPVYNDTDLVCVTLTECLGEYWV